MNKKIPYAEAIMELEEIVAEMEDSGIDVDALAEKVKRASFLIGICRERLQHTEKEVRNVLDTLNMEAGAAEDDA